MMNELLDKSLLLVICVALFVVDKSYPFSVTPVIAAVTLSALLSYFDKNSLRLIGFVGFAVFCAFQPQFTLFLPVFFYDVLLTRKRLIALTAILPFGMQLGRSHGTLNIMTVLFFAIAFLLNRRTVTLRELKAEYTGLRDSAKELSLKLEQKNKDLLEKQDYEINLATLNERNRIAREIHDNVGHLLSSSILQIGALLSVNKDEGVQKGLNCVKNTLSQAMDSIRSSVHDLHDESVDLYTEVKSLVDSFTFCPVHLDYDIDSNPDRKIKYCCLSVIKEALANIIRHSDATQVRVTLREHPAFYQLLIEDNGHVKSFDTDNGIGINNIEDRVSALGGNVHISIQKGFSIFLSIPKAKQMMPK